MMLHTRKFVLVPIFCLSVGVVCGCSTVSDAKVPSQKPPVEVSVPPISMEPAVHEEILRAMDAELKRSMTSLKIDDYQLPYFIAYRLIDTENIVVQGKYGAVENVNSSRSRDAYVEVRVGDYSFDNFANIDSETFRSNEKSIDTSVPYGKDSSAIRGTFWLLTDDAYKQATSDYLTKKGGAIYATDEKKSVPSFSKEKPEVDVAKVKPFSFDTKKWSEIVRAMTQRLKLNRDVVDGSMDVSATRTLRYLVTSEGAKLLESQTIYSIQIQAETIAKDGMTLESSRSFYAEDPEHLPTQKELEEAIDQIGANLAALKQAPTIDPYTGPAILMQEASGVLFHEAVGHRLEGERQRNDDEGQTFKGRVGQVVLPKFLTVYDDPTVLTQDTSKGKVQLNGVYRFDDEGVPAQRALLIDHGVLRNFLKSRTPIEGSLRSNGHGRASGVNKPMARMANLFVVADKDHQMPYAELKKALMAETKKQGKPYGLIIRDITGGSTNTSGYGYQAFKGTPQMIYKVDPDTGKETLVRGAELVGTPLTSINKIVAASNDMGVFNGYCGAESGWVPVSAVAPALLTTEVELQRTQLAKERAPILPAPWADNDPKEGGAEKAGLGKGTDSKTSTTLKTVSKKSVK